MTNQAKTVLLLGALTALIVLFGNLVGGRTGMVVALVLAAGMNFFSYWFSAGIVLRMSGAKEISRGDAPWLFDMVQDLASRAGLPMPRVYVIPQEAPNAFATGRDPAHAAVAVTEGLARLMDREEVRGVLAHEMAHVKNRDILIGTIAATLAGAVMMLADMARFAAIFGGFRGDDDEDGGGLGIVGAILMAILAPIAAMLIQMAVSRSREYLADATGARILGNPEPLASALSKLGAYSGRIPMETSPATSHMYIVNPLSGRSLMNLFSTHPPIEERVARLMEMRGAGGAGGGYRRRDGGPAEENAGEFWESMRR
jgi:heat shock protein HtpX